MFYFFFYGLFSIVQTLHTERVEENSWSILREIHTYGEVKRVFFFLNILVLLIINQNNLVTYAILCSHLGLKTNKKVER